MSFSRKDSARSQLPNPKKRRRVKLLLGFLFAAAMAFAAGQALPASAQSVPTVTRVSPSSGPLVGGQTVVITGSGFTGTTDVEFGTVDATSYAVMNDKQIVAVVPNGAAASKPMIEVTNATGPNTSGATYEYKAPKITKIEPGWAKEDTSSMVTITGEGLLGTVAADVKFGTTNVPVNVWVISDKQIVVETPIDDTTPDPDIVVDNGVVDVTITRNSVASTPDDKSKFLFTPGVPTITDLQDAADSSVTGTDGVAAGEDLTIVGTQLWGLSQVTFGTSKVTSGITINAGGTEATLAVPTRAAGPIDIVATNAAGDSLTNLKTVFSFYSTTAPTITRIYPEALDKTNTTGGGTVLITGRGLTGVGTSEITLTCTTGTPTATSATSISDTSLVVVLSHNAGNAESCDVTIENPTDSGLTVTKTAGVRYV